MDGEAGWLERISEEKKIVYIYIYIHVSIELVEEIRG